MIPGQSYRRREPKGDPFDDVVVRGWVNDDYVREVVVSPLTFGECVSTAPEALDAAYVPVSQATVELEAEIEGWGNKLDELAEAQNA